MEQSAAASHLLVFRETTPERYEAMTVDERRAALDRWNAWCDDLVARGKLLDGNTLAPDGLLVSAARGTRPVDGPFAEAKEVIGGYFLLSAASMDEAMAIARESPNLPHGMEVEVRHIAQACHLARSLGWETMRGPAAV